jgi:hypothetical protein
MGIGDDLDRSDEVIPSAEPLQDLERYRDEYARNPEFFLEDAGPEVEERFARMLEHLDTECGLDIFDG